MNQQGATVVARLEKVGQGWQRVRPYIMGFLVVLVVAGAILALYYVPKMQVPICPPGQDGLPPKICFDIENEARKTLAYILGGILAIIGIYMAHRRIRALERQVLVAQEGQITERFTRAIEHLGSEKIEIRLGGIYALERIANDSDKDYWPIIETLTAYIRERTPSCGQLQDAKEHGSVEEPAPPEGSRTKAVPPKDIQAILTVLGRRKRWYGHGEENSLDLRLTDLRGADLSSAHLEGALITEANLEGANLKKAPLSFSDLTMANMKRAFLDYARLVLADLVKANLEEASLCSAHMRGADLTAAKLKNAYLFGANLERAMLHNCDLIGARLVEASLTGAFLRRANLKGADLGKAQMDKAILQKANLGGASLLNVTGLTREQLNEALLDNKTILPHYLQKRLASEGKNKLD